MLYLDYSRQKDSGCRTGSAAARTEAISFLQQLNSLTHGDIRATMTAAEESTSFPGVSRPVHSAARLHHKWNMGWMHDTLEYLKRIRSTGAGTTA